MGVNFGDPWETFWYPITSLNNRSVHRGNLHVTIQPMKLSVLETSQKIASANRLNMSIDLNIFD